MSYLDQSELDEFIIEAEELLTSAERSFLEVKDSKFETGQYDNIFRVFHSLKGAASMTKMDQLASFMHKAEHQLEEKKGRLISQQDQSQFLEIVDQARLLLRVTEGSDEGVESIAARDSLESTGQGIETISDGTNNNQSVDSKINAGSKVGPIRKADQHLIYIVDDEPDICDILEELLERPDFVTESFTRPEKMMERMKSGFHPDLIISDFKMEPFNGMELLRKVRRKNSTVPFIICSGYLNQDIITEGLSLNLFGAIPKPPDMGHLNILVNSALMSYQSDQLQTKMINFLILQHSYIEKYLPHTAGNGGGDSEFKKNLENILKIRHDIRQLFSRPA